MARGSSCFGRGGALSAAANGLASPTAASQKVRQRHFQWPIGRDAMKGNSQLPANSFHRLAMRREPLLIVLPHRVRFQIQIALAFDVLKQNGLMKIKSQFVR